MAFSFDKSPFSRALAALLSVVAAISLAACGGGGGSAGTNTSGSASATTPTITLKLVDASGAAASLITTSTPLTGQATVLDASGKPVANALVSFSTGKAFTTLTPSSASILTNSNGVATITMAVASLAIAQTEGGTGDILTANATVGTSAVSAKAPFTIGSTAVTLSLAAPNPSTLNMTAYSSTLIKVNVLANGVPYTAAPVVVNFSSACVTSGKASMPATATTVNGQAQVSYTDKGCSATDTVTISVAGATSITASLVIAAPTPASIEFVSATPTGEAIVIQGAGGNGRVETATLTFKALDTFGNPLPNATVNFSVNSTQSVNLESTSAVTDINGQVVVTVSSGTLPTTFRVIATLAGTGQSTISDTISVTTGQPIQLAFSLSAVAHNIEGWRYDDIQTKLSVLLADANGNPVADGTPVVFQTDSGAVGSSTQGGCNTTNGGCTVQFRSQEPRYGVGHLPVPASKRAGLGTVNVSTTSALYSLTGQIGVFLSGSFVDNPVVYYNDKVVTPGSTIALIGCSNTITVQLNDLNNNPMPIDTTVTAAATTNAASVPTAIISQLFPTKVNDIGPHDASGNSTLVVANMTQYQGSFHTISFVPGGGVGSANECSKGANTGTINVTVTTPIGNITQLVIPFSYN